MAWWLGHQKIPYQQQGCGCRCNGESKGAPYRGEVSRSLVPRDHSSELTGLPVLSFTLS